VAKPPSVRSINKEDAQDVPDGLLLPLNTFLSQTHAALSAGLSFRDNFAGEVKTVQVECPEDWTAVTAFNAGWSAYGEAAKYHQPGYRIREDGDGELRGIGACAAATLTPMFTLPEALWPERETSFAVEHNSGVARGRVQQDGSVFIHATAAGYAFLDGVRFGRALKGPAVWASPLKLALGEKFPGKPTGLLVLNAREKTGLPVGSVSADWEPASIEGRQGVKVRRFNGLAPGRKYALTLLVLGE
jgi:hypothetical protein